MPLYKDYVGNFLSPEFSSPSAHPFHLVVPHDVGRPVLQIQVSNRSRARRVVRHLPDLEEVGPAVGDDKVLLAEARGADRVRRAAAVGGGQEEQLARDGARVGVQREGRDVARDVGRPRPGGGVQVLGRGGVLARDDGLVGPVRGRVGEPWSGELINHARINSGGGGCLGKTMRDFFLPSGSSE